MSEKYTILLNAKELKLIRTAISVAMADETDEGISKQKQYADLYHKLFRFLLAGKVRMERL